jgi:hypothetical protein
VLGRADCLAAISRRAWTYPNVSNLPSGGVLCRPCGARPRIHRQGARRERPRSRSGFAWNAVQGRSPLACSCSCDAPEKGTRSFARTWPCAWHTVRRDEAPITTAMWTPNEAPGAPWCCIKGCDISRPSRRSGWRCAQRCQDAGDIVLPQATRQKCQEFRGCGCRGPALPGGVRSAHEAFRGAAASRGPQDRPTTYCQGRLASPE